VKLLCTTAAEWDSWIQSTHFAFSSCDAILLPQLCQRAIQQQNWYN
jgi:hypothetical protein